MGVTSSETTFNDEELITYLRFQGLDKDIAAADRIEELVKERDDAEQREITKIEVNHQRVVSYLTRVKAAEAKLAKAMDVLQELVTCVDDGCYCSELRMAAVVDGAIATLVEIKGET